MVSAVTGDLNQVKSNFSYEIDFDNMMELNTHYHQNPHSIKREPVWQTDNHTWEMQVSKGGLWVQFGLLASQQVTNLPFYRFVLSNL
jgi:hypothetical protein